MPVVHQDTLGERLHHLYVDLGLSQLEVAAQLGVSQPQVHRLMRQYGIPARAAVKRDQVGAANAYWKGDQIGYAAAHKRVEAKYGRPMRCTVCGTEDPSKSYDWANLTGNYPDPDDYQRMCRSCHRQFDKGRRLAGGTA